MREEKREIQRPLRVLEHVKKTGNIRMTCRYFGVGRSTFYRWESAYESDVIVRKVGHVSSQMERNKLTLLEISA